MLSQTLLQSLPETPFKHKSKIRDELVSDLRKVIINGEYLQQSEIEVYITFVNSLAAIIYEIYTKSNVFYCEKDKIIVGKDRCSLQMDVCDT